MSTNEDRRANPSDGDGVRPIPDGEPKRRPYQAPRILSREPLEAIAGFCAKVTPGTCGTMGPANS